MVKLAICNLRVHKTINNNSHPLQKTYSLPCTVLIALQPALVIYCITKNSQIWQLKITNIYFLTVLVGQESWWERSASPKAKIQVSVRLEPLRNQEKTSS